MSKIKEKVIDLYSTDFKDNSIWKEVCSALLCPSSVDHIIVYFTKVETEQSKKQAIINPF